MLFDYVKCTICGWTGLVTQTEEVCQNCNEISCLQWVDYAEQRMEE